MHQLHNNNTGKTVIDLRLKIQCGARLDNCHVMCGWWIPYQNCKHVVVHYFTEISQRLKVKTIVWSTDKPIWNIYWQSANWQVLWRIISIQRCFLSNGNIVEMAYLPMPGVSQAIGLSCHFTPANLHFKVAITSAWNLKVLKFKKTGLNRYLGHCSPTLNWTI